MRRHLLSLILLGNIQLAQAFLIENVADFSSAGSSFALINNDDGFLYEEQPDLCNVTDLSDYIHQMTDNSSHACRSNGSLNMETDNNSTHFSSIGRDGGASFNDLQNQIRKNILETGLVATVIPGSTLIGISAINPLSAITLNDTTALGVISSPQAITSVSAPTSLVLVVLGWLILNFNENRMIRRSGRINNN
ncbi:MAG: hypothetical protein V3V18_03850 [Methylococcales bacterium]